MDGGARSSRVACKHQNRSASQIGPTIALATARSLPNAYEDLTAKATLPCWRLRNSDVKDYRPIEKGSASRSDCSGAQ